MLYSFFGSDTTAVRTKAFSFLHTLEGQNGEPRIITSDEWSEGILRELAGGASLFGGTTTILLDTLSEGEEGTFETLLEDIELLKESSNTFILIEGPLTAAAKRQVEGASKKATEILGKKKEKFNTFLLTDALLQQDKKSLWLLLMKAWREGVENEQIVGILFWQIKMLRLAERVGNAEESGQKAFVYQKAKQALKGFKEGDVDRLSRDLIKMYHDGHAGRVDMSLALEKWVLSI